MLALAHHAATCESPEGGEHGIALLSVDHKTWQLERLATEPPQAEGGVDVGVDVKTGAIGIPIMGEGEGRDVQARMQQ